VAPLEDALTGTVGPMIPEKQIASVGCSIKWNKA
jgi:hypothetical protein